MLKEYTPNIQADVDGFVNYSQMPKNNSKKPFNSYDATFSFATENLKSYLNLLEIANKKVLTVTSSGDHLINLALLNAKEIECFDINRLSYYWTKLKLNLLMFLPYEEFIAYFTYCEDSTILCYALYPQNINENCYDYNIYAKVRDRIEPEIRSFFDKIYEIFGYSGREFSKSGFFNNTSIASAKFNNIYLSSPKNYYEARKKILELYKNNLIRFYDSDLFGIGDLENEFNLALISNIYDYIPMANKEAFVDFIINDMSRILTANAQVIVEYQYCGSHDKDINSSYQFLTSSYSLPPEMQALSKLNLSTIAVPSIHKRYRESGLKDCVYVYKR